MKIKKEHYEYLKKEIEIILKKYPDVIKEYETGNFPRSEDVKVLQTRFNYDLMYGAGLQSFVCDTLYTYLHDNHISTALKNICPKIVRRY